MEVIEVIPVNNLNGTVEIPGSKSYTNRALLIASLAKGKSNLKNVLLSDDTLYMADGLRKFGIEIIEKENSFTVYGTGGKLHVPESEIFLGNAGTATRFLTALCALCPGRVTITGDERMKERPVKELLTGLRQLNINASSFSGCPPLTVDGGTFSGTFCEMRGHISSQYFTALMMIGPYGEKDVTIKVKGELASRSYIDITLHIMKEFGVPVDNKDYKEFFIKSGRIYRGRDFVIEGDASSASYFFAIPAIAGGKITVKNINPASLQGDIKFLDILEKMGCKVTGRENEVEVEGRALRGVEVDMNTMPDAVQTLSVIAPFVRGETVIKNVSNLRIKETDRLKAIAKELGKMGVEVREFSSGIAIKPGKVRGAEIETYNDHRMAMSFSLMGLEVPGIKIRNPQCVSKSFPFYWRKLKDLRVEIKNSR